MKRDQKPKKKKKKECSGSWGSRAHSFIHSQIISSFHFSFVEALKPFDPALGTALSVKKGFTGNGNMSRGLNTVSILTQVARG